MTSMSRAMLLLSAGLSLLGCTPSAGEQEVELGGATSLAITNPAGMVSMLGGSISDVVFLSYEVHSEDGQATVADVDLVAGPSGSTFLVSVSTPGPHVWVDIVLGVPSSLPYTVATGSGDVFVESMDSSGEVLTSTGFISGGDLAGGLVVAAESSEVSLEVILSAGDVVDVALEQGPIVLTVPTGTDASLVASTDEGDVVIWDVPFSGDAGSSSADGVLGVGGAGSVMLHTGQGDISIFGSESL